MLPDAFTKLEALHYAVVTMLNGGGQEDAVEAAALADVVRGVAGSKEGLSAACAASKE